MFKISGLILLAGVFEFNVILTTMLAAEGGLTKDSIAYQYRYFVVGGCLLVFLPLLYLRFFRIKSYDQVNDEFNMMSDRKRKMLYVLSVLYVLVSVIGLFGYAIMTRARH
jgi:hypothetical protein